MRLIRIVLATASVALFSLPLAAQTSPATIPGRTVSHSLTLVVEGKPTVYSLADLAALPHIPVAVHNKRTNTDDVYSGVPLASLLAAHGVTYTGGDVPLHKFLRCYIVAHSTDDYFVTFSSAEVFPDFHTGDVIVADSVNGKPIAVNGQLELVSSEDKRPSRLVYSLAKIIFLESPGE